MNSSAEENDRFDDSFRFTADNQSSKTASRRSLSSSAPNSGAARLATAESVLERRWPLSIKQGIGGYFASIPRSSKS
jgi:hypothetical protein